MRPVLLHVWSIWECLLTWSSGSVIGILAQRLVRVICSKCKQSYTPPERELQAAGITPEQAASANFMKGAAATTAATAATAADWASSS